VARDGSTCGTRSPIAAGATGGKFDSTSKDRALRCLASGKSQPTQSAEWRGLSSRSLPWTRHPQTCRHAALWLAARAAPQPPHRERLRRTRRRL